MHCVVHKTNLVVPTLFELPMVGNIKALLMGVYAYFSHSPRRNLKRWKLAKTMETKGLNILWNIKIRWINIVIPSKVVLEEFMTHLVRMAQDFTINKFAVVNYELLCDVDTIMGFICMILMLEFVQILNKYVCQNKKDVCLRFCEQCQVMSSWLTQEILWWG